MIQIKKNKFLQNVGWMYGIKAVNYIFPLLLIPYLVRVIGLEKYGLLTATQALMGYFTILVNYGFELTATRTIAMNVSDMAAVRREYNEVMSARLILLFGVGFLFGIGLWAYPVQMEYKIFLGMGFLLVIGDLFFPSWFFQGMQDMRTIAVINFSIKSLYLLFTVVLVRTESDYLNVILCQGMAWLISGSISMYLIRRVYGFWFRPVFSRSRLKKQFQEGFPIFVANACGNVYSKGAVILTSLIAGNVAAGYYSLAEKICGTVASLVLPYVSVLYPSLCQKYQNSIKDFYQFFHDFYKYMAMADVGLISCLWIFAGFISWIIQGEVDDSLVSLVRGMSFVTVGTIINVLLHPFILAAGRYKSIQKIYMSVSLMFLCVSIPLLHLFSYWGMVISMIVVEYTISFCYMYQLRKAEKSDVA